MEKVLEAEEYITEENDAPKKAEALVKIQFTPATIAGNLEAIDEKVSALTEQVTAGTIDATDPEQVRWAKKNRAYVNSLQKSLSAERIRVERELMAPWQPFKDKCKDLEAKLKETSGYLKGALDEAEEARRIVRRSRIEEEFKSYAGLLADVVTVDQIMEPSWLTKSVSEQKAAAELRAKVNSISQCWETLRGFESEPNYDVAEREFYSSLDLGAAIQAMRDATQRDEELAKLRETTGVVEAKKTPAEAPQEDEEGETVYTWVDSSEGVTEEVKKPLEGTREQPLKTVEEAHEKLCEYQISIDAATEEDMLEVARIIKTCGLSGRITPLGIASPDATNKYHELRKDTRL